MILDDLLVDHPGPILVDEDGTAYDGAAFEDLVASAVAFLSGRGLEEGDCVAVWLPNVPAWPALLFAAARLGVRVAAANTRYGPAEMEHLIATSGARLLVLDPSWGQTAAVLDAVDRSAIPALEQVVTFLPPSDAATSIDRDPDPDAPLVHFTTSGTTSAPKLVTHTPGTLVAHARLCAAALGFDEPGAGFLAAMPLCGVFGMAAFLAAIAGGAPIHLQSAFDAGPAAAVVAARGITHLVGSDEMFRRLLAVDPSVLDGTRFCGFADFTPGLGPVMRRAAERGIPLRGVYGSSEVLALFAAQPESLPLDERLRAGGRPANPDAAVRVVGPEGEVVAIGVHGALEVRSPTNFVGYHADPSATAAAHTPDGWFRTGDIGYLRGDGTFVYLARGGDALRLSGFLVAPAEIEAALGTSPGVTDAQVVGVEVGRRTRVVAFVIGTAVDPDAVRSHVVQRLAHFKVPERVVVVDEFPTVAGANGVKIQKHRLREMARDLFAD